MRWTLLTLLFLLGCPGEPKIDDSAGPPSVDADGDGFDEANDCDDLDADVHPGADELCNGVDDDCDGFIDSDDPGLLDGAVFYADKDADGYGDIESPASACSASDGTVDDASDCDDGDASIHPDGEELCNGLDDDCDGDIDEGLELETWFMDADADGYGDDTSMVEACVAPDGTVADSSDCDDADGTINPGAAELCNDLDDDCDGDIDEDIPETATWFTDADGDGYGDPYTGIEACAQPSGTVALAAATDCDDTDATIHPNASEICDGVDNDCDGDIDEDLASTGTWYADADGDGYGDGGTGVEACAALSGHVADATDCDDSDAAINPSAAELCDGYDNDCDGLVDGDDGSVTGLATWYTDADGDGFGDAAVATISCSAPSGTVSNASDCDDTDYNINPVATELCNGVDDDCDGTVDVGAADVLTWYADADADAYGDPAVTAVACDQPAGYVADSSDCDDTLAYVYPGADEYCNGTDDDCDGTVDIGAVDVSTWYADADSDGYGDASISTIGCTQPTGYVADNTDCDDTMASVYPGATETCNGVDDDCDGDIDEGAAGSTPYYADADGDSYGDAGDVDYSCTAPSGYVADSTDCDDTDAAINPAAAEHCNGLDDDCDGTVDVGATDESIWYADGDGDGYGDTGSTTTACSPPSGYVGDDTDCHDADAAVHPGATETCNSVDDDCDGDIDEDASDATAWYPDGDGDGYGDTSSVTYDCGTLSGMTTTGGDCDDLDPLINPTATEYCDGVDTDCDGTLDPSSTVTFVSSAGVKSDVTSTFTLSSSASPDTYVFSDDGTLYLCAGSYDAFIEVSAADASIVGMEGSGSTELSAGYFGTNITALTGAANLSVSGLSLIEGSGTNGGAISSIIVGLDFYGEDLVVTQSLATNGGGIYLKDAASVSLQVVEVSSCVANKGGGLYIDEGVLDFDDVWVTLNVAADQGGAAWMKDVTGSAVGLLVSENAATSKGGGLYIDDAIMSIEDSELSDNICSSNGGAIALKSTSELTLIDTLVEANIAVSGGGLYLEDTSFECVGTSTGAQYEGFVGNLATYGGAVYVKGNNGDFEADTCDFGIGSDDNSVDDVYTDHTDTSYTYDDDESFTCDKSSCW